MAPSGRTPPTSQDDPARARRRRGLEEPLDYAVRDPAPVVVLRVRNPVHGTQYLLFLPAYPSVEWGLCTCPDFARRGLGTCKHLEGATRWIPAHPREGFPPARAVPAPDLWSVIDRRQELARSGAIDGSTLRAIGAVLVEASPA